MTQERLNLADLKAHTPKDLLSIAEELEIENASTMRKGDMMFAILKERAEEGWEISGDGVLEVLQDGFGFLRSPEANYLPGPDDIYVSPEMIRQHSLRTGDTVDGVIQAPGENERYFAITKVSQINFDNLTPLYPDERFNLEIEDPTIKDRTARIIDLVAPIGKGQR
ncbi:MAG: Rho termination factor N-terminal domain-containing protein, partial [Paracoccaceae bacterium]